ncbi:sigma-70 family RNA polymerase sigma factor [Lactobacillus xylocopicola]|uniref:Sigma-70 family RNA polymerase sigma factor n=1 Tax=Lactobacillus xylocopicola TaxID=2976676 RepID=A0ABM8BIH5_9LACO|nr:sigma-70 family RNA polymerase sigma factor [Lactobacillus xylocopicola]BDR61099.1 hypothetical protein KIM322_13600 [Lactobacillus xylocopicola]
MKISKRAFLTAWNNQRLVRGALQSAHVRYNHPNYEDFLQEGILLYAELLSQSRGLPRTEVDRRSFRKIVWRTIDQLRKNQRQETQELGQDLASVSQLMSWDNYLTLEHELVRMAPIERIIFFKHLVLKQPVNSLVVETGLSRVQLQRIKRSLVIRLRNVLEN